MDFQGAWLQALSIQPCTQSLNPSNLMSPSYSMHLLSLIPCRGLLSPTAKPRRYGRAPPATAPPTSRLASQSASHALRTSHTHNKPL